MPQSNECQRAYEMERRGYAFLDGEEIRWLRNHIKHQHPEQWMWSKLNPTNV